MALDDATYISELDAALPNDADPVSEGNNNFQHVKTVLKNSLPNISAPMTETPAVLNGLDARVTALEGGGLDNQAIFDLLYPVGTVYFGNHDMPNLPSWFTSYGTWASFNSEYGAIFYTPTAQAGAGFSTSFTVGVDDKFLYVRAWVRTA